MTYTLKQLITDTKHHKRINSTKLARLLNVSKSLITHLEKNGRMPKIDILKKIFMFSKEKPDILYEIMFGVKYEYVSNEEEKGILKENESLKKEVEYYKVLVMNLSKQISLAPKTTGTLIADRRTGEEAHSPGKLLRRPETTAPQ